MKCPQCRTENRADSRFCVNCGATLNVAPPPDEGIRGRRPSVAKKYAQNKNSTMALLLSLIPLPGIGQFYNRDVMKGVVMLVGAFFLGSITAGVGYLAIWIWAVVDAYQVAKGNWSLWN